MKVISPIEPSKEHIEMMEHFKNIEKQIVETCGAPKELLQPKLRGSVAIMAQLQTRMSIIINNRILIIINKLYQDYLNIIIEKEKYR